MPNIKEKYIVKRLKTGDTVETNENLLWLFEKPKGDLYFMVFETILKNNEITLTHVKVYYHLTTIMKPGGWIMPTQKAIASELNMDPVQFNKALNKLKEYGYLTQEIHPEEQRKVYRVNPFYSAKGSIAMRKSQIESDARKEVRENNKKERGDE